jgi:hypothetical protein
MTAKFLSAIVFGTPFSDASLEDGMKAAGSLRLEGTRLELLLDKFENGERNQPSKRSG